MDNGLVAMMTMAATMLSIEECLDRLIEAAKEQRVFPSEENERTVDMYCQLYMIRRMTKGDMGEAIKLVQNFEDTSKATEFFKTGKN